LAADRLERALHVDQGRAGHVRAEVLAQGNQGIGIAEHERTLRQIHYVDAVARDPLQGEPLCPAIAGGVSWNSGAYSPKTGLYYKIGNEWCITLDVKKTTPVTEPQVQLNIGADFKFVPPPGQQQMTGHLDARDPVTGQLKWQVTYAQPPLASVLATGGNLVFVPDAAGIIHAYDAETGKELWSHNDGIGHAGGIISYAAGGKEYIAVAAGWGSLVGEGYGGWYGEPWKSMPLDAGALIVYALPSAH
jgi:outer membrane protein assembly factor BamB